MNFSFSQLALWKSSYVCWFSTSRASSYVCWFSTSRASSYVCWFSTSRASSYVCWFSTSRASSYVCWFSTSRASSYICWFSTSRAYERGGSAGTSVWGRESQECTCESLKGSIDVLFCFFVQIRIAEGFLKISVRVIYKYFIYSFGRVDQILFTIKQLNTLLH
jgi:hypothetical protein